MGFALPTGILVTIIMPSLDNLHCSVTSCHTLLLATSWRGLILVCPYCSGSDWAFNLERGEATAAKAKEIPTGTDVLITHGPPLGQGDQTSEAGRVGCDDLLAEVQQRVKPVVHVFGHIHNGYGVTSDGTTAYVNASTCTSAYEPTHPPIVYDLELVEKGGVSGYRATFVL